MCCPLLLENMCHSAGYGEHNKQEGETGLYAKDLYSCDFKHQVSQEDNAKLIRAEISVNGKDRQGYTTGMIKSHSLNSLT